MQTIVRIDQSLVTRSLDNYQYTVPAAQAGMFVVDVQASHQEASSLVITINQNGSPMLVVGPPKPAQIHSEARIILNCAASDVIEVVLSSAAPIDNELNSIKAIINVRQGTI